MNDDEKRQRLAELITAAALAAGAPPERPAQYVSSAMVPWTRIQRLRDALDAVDMDWRNLR